MTTTCCRRISSLNKLGLSVSTGRVVDFRAREHLRQTPEQETVPLIYPCHFLNGFVKWPVESGKKAEDKIKETLAILNDLGLPRQQQNERSALTLLSLLGLKPASKWEDAADPLMGITPMMDFFEEHYGKKYAPNTRETVRRRTAQLVIMRGENQ